MRSSGLAIVLAVLSSDILLAQNAETPLSEEDLAALEASAPSAEPIPSSSEPSPSPSPTASPAPRPSSAAKFSQYLAIIEGDEGKGSGFIAMFLDKPFLFTNSHVLSGNSRIQARLLSGKNINLQGLSVADSYDVSIFQQDTVATGMEILKDIDSQVAIGDEVVVLGNSLGAGVVTELPGKVTGIGPELVEVDAAFVSGNSGSPVVHLKTGKVIGIATFSTMRKMDGFGKDSRFNSVERRFAYRLDNVPAWHNTTWVMFAKESLAISSIQKRTDDIWNLAVDIAENGRVTDWHALKRKDNHLYMTASNWQKSLQSSAGSAQNRSDKDRFLNGVLNALRSDLSFINPRAFTAFHQKVLQENMNDRQVLKTYFENLQTQLREDPNALSY